MQLPSTRFHTFGTATTVSLLYLALLAMAPTYAIAKETLFIAKYKGSFSAISAKSTRKLIQKDNGELVFFSVAENAIAKVSERSWFSLENNQMIPSHYIYKRKVFGFGHQERVDFDWQTNLASYANKSKPKKNKTHKITEGMLDSSLYQLQLQRDLYAGKTTDLKYEYVKRHKVKSMEFEITGEEPFEIKNTIYKAVKLKRVNFEDKKQTYIWVMPELNYQICKILHIEENGDTFNIVMTSYEASPKLISIFHQPPTEKNIKNDKAVLQNK